jgi:hypothetical protein
MCTHAINQHRQTKVLFGAAHFTNKTVFRKIASLVDISVKHSDFYDIVWQNSFTGWHKRIND